MFKGFFKRSTNQEIKAKNEGSINQAARDIIITEQKMEKDYEVSFSDLFILKKGIDVTAKDILSIRADKRSNFNSEFYIKRDYLDSELTKNIIKKKHTIIVGKPLSGKSRTLYESVKNELQNYDVYILKQVRANVDQSKIDLQAIRQPSFIIITDLHEFLKRIESVAMIKEMLLNEYCTIVADVRRERFGFVRSNLTDLFENFHIIEITEITDNIREQLKFVLKDFYTSGDDTIGSYFLDLVSL